MNGIKITDNFEEMEKIGKNLIEEKCNIYKPEMLDTLRRTIEIYMPGAIDLEKEKRLYRAIYDYWMYGASISEVFYLGFDSLNNEQKLEYATLRLKMAYYGFLNDTLLAHLFDNKEETYELFKEFYLRDVIKICNESDYDVFSEFVERHPSFVVKPSSMATGLGVRKVVIPNDANLKQVFLNLFHEYMGYNAGISWKKPNKTIILEELIEQDDALARLHPDSVNGIRVTTVRAGGVVHIYQPWIKVGAKGAFVASAALGGMDIGINAETGVLETAGYGELGESYLKHPDTGVEFIGYQIPKWDELVVLAKKLAGSLPERINYIGWDFVLTPKGWCVMEGNFRGDFMWQLFRRRGMRREFEELIGWKSTKRYWWE